MIRAVIFDCFGVLTTDGWLAFRERFLNASPDKLALAIASNKRVDAGVISYNDFIHEIAELAGITDEKATQIIEGNTENESLFEYIRDEIKPRYKVGMLSNAGDNWLDRLFEPWQVELFDEVVLSYQVGAIKPDPIMYQTIADKLGVLPEECLYIDDQERYVQGARDIGMTAIHFRDTYGTIAQIKEQADA